MRRISLAIAVVAVLAGCGGAAPHILSRPDAKPKPSGPFAHRLSLPHLARGSDPAALPGDVLIADRSNNRLLVVDPQGRIVWRFGSARRLPLPDDAMMIPGGAIVSADIENCRLIELRPPAHRPAVALGSLVRGCVHAPPQAWDSPNGAFPRTGGGWIVTEINGDWVDALSPSGHVLWATHPPGIYYPSDTNEVRRGLFLTVGWESPGVVEEFARSGRLVWRYAPRPGDPQLDHPSLALPLPNGDVLLNDDFNDRVIVIDPHTNKIVWQYGHTGRPGTAPGYLSRPDGDDLAPPLSLLAGAHAKMRLR